MRFLQKFLHFWFGGLAEKCGTLFVVTAFLAGLSALVLFSSWPKALGIFFCIIAVGYIKQRQGKHDG